MKSSSRSEQALFATCPHGLEATLAEELESLGANDVRAAEGGSAFRGTLATVYRVNYGSRIASRVLLQVTRGRYRSEEDIYRGVYLLEWPGLFSADLTIRVNVSAIASPLKSLEFVTLRIKDAVCDRFRAELNKRPSVDTVSPDVRIHAFLTAQEYTIYLDTSGAALFKRGYRTTAGEAPLRENLAAGVIRLTQWKPDWPLLDPMCGGATLLIEAAQMALAIPAGARRGFGFEKLHSFDPQLWREVRSQWRSGPARSTLAIYGSDRDPAAVEAARRNLAAAGLAHAVHLRRANALGISAPADAGVLVINPPYGVRLEQQQSLERFYPKLGDALKQNFAGWRAYIFTSDLRLPKLIGLTASKRTPLYNGALECRLYEFKLVSGSMRRKAKDSDAT
ncbi:MAG: THUMP domain-containing class I SAM-dependent RNA methyltransferase [Burkholderiales bacterium]